MVPLLSRVLTSLEYRRIAGPPSLASSNSNAVDAEPLWELQTNLLGEAAQHRPTKVEPVEGVDGAFLVHDVLLPDECRALIHLSESIGFSHGETLVEVPRDIRSNDVVVFAVQNAMAAILSERLKTHVPMDGHGNAKRTDPTFVNQRWRCYRYLPPRDCDENDGKATAAARGQAFGPHYDGAQPLNVVKDSQLVDEEPAKGIVRLSQLTILLYLNDGHAGGDTIFYPTKEATPDAPTVRVAPRMGAALCFRHGHHPLSPLHAGSPLLAGAREPKYVIRTEALYATEAAPANSDTWMGSSYARALMHAHKASSAAP